MVRLFVYDKDFENGEFPSDIVEYEHFNGKFFHNMTRAFYALYEGLEIRLVYEENSTGEFRPFAVVTIEVKNGVFSRRIERTVA